MKKPRPPVLDLYRDEGNVPRMGLVYGGTHYYEHAARDAYEAFVVDLETYYKWRLKKARS